MCGHLCYEESVCAACDCVACVPARHFHFFSPPTAASPRAATEPASSPRVATDHAAVPVAATAAVARCGTPSGDANVVGKALDDLFPYVASALGEHALELCVGHKSDYDK